MILQYLQVPLTKFSGWGIAKLLGSVMLLETLINFTIPSLHLLFWLGIVLTVDLVTGWLKVLLTDPKSFSSHKARASVSKIIQYGGAIGVVVLVSQSTLGKQYEHEVTWIVNGVYSLLFMIEFISIIENLRDMAPNTGISQYVFSPLLIWLKFRVKKTNKETPGVTEVVEEDVIVKASAPPIPPIPQNGINEGATGQ